MKRFRFTLMELLVVVAIVAILAALLLPALTHARERAKMVVCASQHRQLGVLFTTYYNDFDDALPGQRTPSQCAFGAMTTTTGFGILTHNEYCEVQAVFACPAANYLSGAENQMVTGACSTWQHFRRVPRAPRGCLQCVETRRLRLPVPCLGHCVKTLAGSGVFSRSSADRTACRRGRERSRHCTMAVRRCE